MTRLLLALRHPAAWYGRRPSCDWTHPWHPHTPCRLRKGHRTPHRFRWAHGGTSTWPHTPEETK